MNYILELVNKGYKISFEPYLGIIEGIAIDISKGRLASHRIVSYDNVSASARIDIINASIRDVVAEFEKNGLGGAN